MKTSQLVSRYLLKMDELNAALLRVLLAASIITPEEAVEAVSEFLIDAYIEGFAGVGYLLGDDSDRLRLSQMDTAMRKKIDGKTFRERVFDYAVDGDTAGILLVANTDGHRVFNAGASDRATMFAAQAGVKLSKTWVTVMDDKVRETHSYLQGESVPFESMFFTFDGDFGNYPGDFNRVENNANCRCILSYSFRK